MTPRNTMRFRKLRIAWSVGCGIVCVLLIVLWVRSYWICDIAYGWFGFPGYLQIDSNHGDIKLIANAEFMQPKWRYTSCVPSVNDRLWFAKLDTKSRFGWWLNVSVPHWFSIVVTANIAAAPWFGWSNRFSLRTLLIATTLVAVMLGIIVWSSR
jgi:hypothetical protein